ncbi:hypothetical protein JXB28_00625 [Candidatus Woesearchaeota archaeon]|nr:hypothetical protein [Candidatus Woesearchaeota archaeon]
MVSKKDTLDRLNMEKDYEDQLVKNLNYYFLSVLDDLPNMEAEERQKIRQHLTTIMYDSARHSALFNQLVHMVFTSENDKF